jgi:trans-aconitate methyltransferase
MSGWNPSQYLKFTEERTCRGLAARVAVANLHRAIDQGCGRATAPRCSERSPQAYLTGLDSFAEMIDRARRERFESPRQYRIAGYIGRWAEGNGDRST